MTSRVPSFAEPGAARRLGRAAFALLLAAGLAGCQSVGDFFGFGSRNNSGVAQGTPGYVRGFLGGVASEDPAASVIARRVLSAGGSATDAAVAAGFTLATCSACHTETVKSDGSIDAVAGRHVNGAIDGFAGHPLGWLDSASSNFHGRQAASGLTGCQKCHALTPPASVSAITALFSASAAA